VLRGAFFHETDDDWHTHDDDPSGAAGLDIGLLLDNVELTTVGIDVGSSTSHLLFGRLQLKRLTRSLSSRFVVVKREVLSRSPILLTPYRDDGLIDVTKLEAFVHGAYAEAGLEPSQIDTGAVILTGAALERANARAVAELFAGEGGKFVCASAGHNLEAMLAAHGSGAVALSRSQNSTLLHVDIGGGTTKLSLLRAGEVLSTAAVHVGGRLVAFDADERVTRIEPSAQLLAEQLGIGLQLGGRLAQHDQQRLADCLGEILVDYVAGREPNEVGKQFLLTEPLEMDGLAPVGVTFSGGVAEYVYGREASEFGDLGPLLGDAMRRAAAERRLPADPVPLQEGIRATVLGASQFSVQLSGNTVHVSDPSILPLRNLPVVFARPNADDVAESIRRGFTRLDLVEGEAPVALAVPWRGAPHYAQLRALAEGIVQGLRRSLECGFPIVIALEGDIAASLGAILTEDLNVTAPLICIDGLELVELDFVDLGEVIQPANVVPVVVKSLAFAQEVPAHDVHD
jgi:ethanolamine utilization protein EutA